MQGSIGNSGQVDDYTEQLRAKLPTAPEGLLSGYVNWAPWVAMVFGAIGILAFISLFALGAALTPLYALGGAEALRYGGMAMVGALAGVASSALDFAGGFLMLRKRLLGWWILALGLAVGIVTNVVHLAIVSLVISLLIAWIHLGVKPRYH